MTRVVEAADAELDGVEVFLQDHEHNRDFEVDPEDPEHLIATTERQLYRSEDGGESWALVSRDRNAMGRALKRGRS